MLGALLIVIVCKLTVATAPWFWQHTMPFASLCFYHGGLLSWMGMTITHHAGHGIGLGQSQLNDGQIHGVLI